MSAKPRWIRKVTKMGRDGRPKIARDRRAGITVERIIARNNHNCAKPGCPWGIGPGRSYAKVTFPLIGFSKYPVSQSFHWTCLPEEAVPLRRFFGTTYLNGRL